MERKTKLKRLYTAGSDPKEQLALVAGSIGNFIEYWGFKSIQGRIWALIFLSDEPISTPEIVEILEVSKASVSIGINDLIELKLIITSGKVRNGAVTYAPTPDAGAVVRKVLRERELMLITEAETNLNLLFSMTEKNLNKQNISQVKLRQLLELTRTSKKMVSNLTSERFKTISTWALHFKKALHLV
jgi:DNA-binding transcriptional regulator GbsR (MarR family)